MPLIPVILITAYDVIIIIDKKQHLQALMTAGHAGFQAHSEHAAVIFTNAIQNLNLDKFVISH